MGGVVRKEDFLKEVISTNKRSFQAKGMAYTNAKSLLETVHFFMTGAQTVKG